MSCATQTSTTRCAAPRCPCVPGPVGGNARRCSALANSKGAVGAGGVVMSQLSGADIAKLRKTLASTLDSSQLELFVHVTGDRLFSEYVGYLGPSPQSVRR